MEWQNKEKKREESKTSIATKFEIRDQNVPHFDTLFNFTHSKREIQILELKFGPNQNCSDILKNSNSKFPILRRYSTFQIESILFIFRTRNYNSVVQIGAESTIAYNIRGQPPNHLYWTQIVTLYKH